MDYSCCLVVPHFNHSHAFSAFVPRLVALDLPCIVVDDGSAPQQLEKLKTLLLPYPQITLIQHSQNRGKGAAMWTGAHAARVQGHTHMLQIDADGQHDTADVARFLTASQANPTAIVSGAPQFDDSAPKARVYGRKVTDFWVALETGTNKIKDSLCGFRVYPLTQFEQVFDRYHIGKRMDFDTDVLVKSVWAGVPIRFIETKVVYLENSVSHFHYLEDNLRLIWLHTRLMVGMVIRLPMRVGCWLRQRLSRHPRAS